MAAANVLEFSDEQTSLPPSFVLREALLSKVDVPVVFKNLVGAFPAVSSDIIGWREKHADTKLKFRIAQKSHNGIAWERQTRSLPATITQFLDWQSNGPEGMNPDSPFLGLKKEEHWAYTGYNHIIETFPEDSELVKNISWSQLGFPEITGRESTFWMGSQGANTPCHFDSYGCNLVLQVMGRKKWTLFPPSDSSFLYPTRIPFEESSVFSSVDIREPNLLLHPRFKFSHPHVVTLEPGEVLFVPHGWWHFVECMEDITISINAWINLDSDYESRVEESVAKTLMTSLISQFHPSDGSWFNSKEEENTFPGEMLKYIHLSLQELSSIRDYPNEGKTANSKKLPKTSLTSDTASIRCQKGVDILCYEGISKVKPIDFDCWLGYSTPKERSEKNPSLRGLTTQEILNCFGHPEVVALISRLLIRESKK